VIPLAGSGDVVNGASGGTPLTLAALAALQPFPVTIPENMPNPAKGDLKNLNNVETTAASAVVKSPSNPWTEADVGKYIAITGAGEEALEEGRKVKTVGEGAEPSKARQFNTLCARIAAVKAPGEIELDTVVPTAVKGALCVYASDDTTAFIEAFNQGAKEAQERGTSEFQVWCAHHAYGIAGPLQTGSPTYGNAQIPLPLIACSGGEVKDAVTKAGSKILTSATARFKSYDVGAELIAAGKIKPGTTIARVISEAEVEMSEVAEAEGAAITLVIAATIAQGQSQKIHCVLRGSSEAAQLPQWYQLVPQQSGLLLFSFGPKEAGGKLANKHAQPEYSATNGVPSMIGGPTPEQGFEGLRYSNMMFSAIGVTTSSASNGTMTMIDLEGVSEVGDMRHGCYALAIPSLRGENYTGGSNEFVKPWKGYEGEFAAHKKPAAALRMPGRGNNDNSLITQHSVEGHTCAIAIGEHAWHTRMNSIYCLMGATLQSKNFEHISTIGYWSIEGCVFGLYAPGGAEGGIQVLKWDSEQQGGRWAKTADIYDPENVLSGEINMFLVAPPPKIFGARRLTIKCNLGTLPGTWGGTGRVLANGYNAIAVPASGVAVQNTFWRDAWVTIRANAGASGACNVTADGFSEFTGNAVEAKPEITNVLLPAGTANPGKNSLAGGLVNGARLTGAGAEGLEVESYNAATKVLKLKANCTAKSIKATYQAVAPAQKAIPAGATLEVFVPAGCFISLSYTEAPTWDWSLA
jgi:hypothetical protein